jgi:hypothetical protein
MIFEKDVINDEFRLFFETDFKNFQLKKCKAVEFYKNL